MIWPAIIGAAFFLFVFVIPDWLATRYDSRALCMPIITPYVWDSLPPAVPAWLSRCLPYFWSMVTVGFDKREASAPVDSLAKCGTGVPFIHFLWFTRRSLKFSGSRFWERHISYPPPYLFKLTQSTNLQLALNRSPFKDIVVNWALFIARPVSAPALNKDFRAENMLPEELAWKMWLKKTERDKCRSH